jgi:ABC-2 type transport system permease protein
VIDRMATSAWVVAAAMRTQHRALRGNPFNLVLGVVQPVVLLVVTAGTYQSPTAAEATRLVVGVALTALWGSTVWAAGGILQRERNEGTLAASVAGVHSPYLLLLGKSLAATLRSSIFIAVSVVVATILLGLPVRPALSPWLPLGLVLVLSSGTALGMLLSCLFLITRHGLAWSSALMYPVFIVGGMMLPVHVLPEPLQWVSALVSLRWGAQFLTAAVAGGSSITGLAALAALTVAYLALAVAAFRVVLRKALSAGSLDLV